MSKFEHSLPNKFSKIQNTNNSVTIFYTNNFQSNFDGTVEELIPNTPVRVGGTDITLNYLKRMREHIGSDSLLVDAGNFLRRNVTQQQLQITTKLFQAMNYDAILLTENELQVIPESSTVNLPFTNTNIINLKTDEITNFKGNTPYIIKEINGHKIGIIGLTLYKENKSVDQNGFIFDDPIARFIITRNQIKDDIDATIVLIHHMSKCAQDNIKDYRSCSANDTALYDIVSRFPPNSVDLVIGGDGYPSSSVINNIPVAQNFGKGKFLGIAQLEFDNQKNVIEANTSILSPLKLCNQFFEQTTDCHISSKDKEKEKLIRDSGNKLINARLFGKEIYRDLELEKYLKTN